MLYWFLCCAVFIEYSVKNVKFVSFVWCRRLSKSRCLRTTVDGRYFVWFTKWSGNNCSTNSNPTSDGSMQPEFFCSTLCAAGICNSEGISWSYHFDWFVSVAKDQIFQILIFILQTTKKTRYGTKNCNRWIRSYYSTNFYSSFGNRKVGKICWSSWILHGSFLHSTFNCLYLNVVLVVILRFGAAGEFVHWYGW